MDSYLTRILLCSKKLIATKNTLILILYLDYKNVTGTFDEPLIFMKQHRERLPKCPNSYAVLAANYF